MLTLGLELLEADDGKILDEPLLDLLEPVVVLVELLAGVAEEGAVLEPIRGGRVRVGCR